MATERERPTIRRRAECGDCRLAAENYVRAAREHYLADAAPTDAQLVIAARKVTRALHDLHAARRRASARERGSPVTLKAKRPK